VWRGVAKGAAASLQCEPLCSPLRRPPRKARSHAHASPCRACAVQKVAAHPLRGASACQQQQQRENRWAEQVATAASARCRRHVAACVRTYVMVWCARRNKWRRDSRRCASGNLGRRRHYHSTRLAASLSAPDCSPCIAHTNGEQCGSWWPPKLGGSRLAVALVRLAGGVCVRCRRGCARFLV